MAYGAILGQTPQVATTVAEGNNKPVTSNAVYEAIQPLTPVDTVASGNDFPVTSNAVFNAISAIPEGVKIVIGQYIGTGDSGVSSPTTLTFNFNPKFVWIFRENSTSQGSYPMNLTFFSEDIYYNSHLWELGGYNESYNILGYSFVDNTITWSAQNSAAQANVSGRIYSYIAIG